MSLTILVVLALVTFAIAFAMLLVAIREVIPHTTHGIARKNRQIDSVFSLERSDQVFDGPMKLVAETLVGSQDNGFTHRIRHAIGHQIESPDIAMVNPFKRGKRDLMILSQDGIIKDRTIVMPLHGLLSPTMYLKGGITSKISGGS